MENDEFSYSVDDLLPLCEELNIPLVFGEIPLPRGNSMLRPHESDNPRNLADYHHHSIFPTERPIEELMPRILAIWEKKGIRPKFHLSEPRKGAVTPMVCCSLTSSSHGIRADQDHSPAQERRAHADRCQRLPSPLPDDIGESPLTSFGWFDLAIDTLNSRNQTS